MKYLIDYENVGSNGFEGFEKLTKDDEVLLFYSGKNGHIDIDVMRLCMDPENEAKVSFVKSEKTAPNYMDFWIVSESAKILLKEDASALHIISQDKGYISAKDYFEEIGKQIHISKTILLAMQIPAMPPRKNESIPTTTKEPALVTPVKEPDKNAKSKKTDTVADIKKQVSEMEEFPSVDNIGRIQTIDGKKKLTAAQKNVLREVLKDFPSRDGKLNNYTFQSIENANTLGELHMNLISSLGRNDGQRVYKAIENIYKQLNA